MKILRRTAQVAVAIAFVLAIYGAGRIEGYLLGLRAGVSLGVSVSSVRT